MIKKLAVLLFIAFMFGSASLYLGSSGEARDIQLDIQADARENGAARVDLTGEQSAIAPTGDLPGYFRDDFSNSTLDPAWSWIREDPTRWSLTQQPGNLRITTQYGTLDSSHTARNLLVRDAPPSDYTLSTSLVANTTANYHEAVLLLYSDDDNYIKLSKIYQSALGGHRYLLMWEQNGSAQRVFVAPAVGLGAKFRLLVVGETVRGQFWNDSGQWVDIGTITLPSAMRFAKVGVSAFHGVVNPPPIAVDFDFVDVSTLLAQNVDYEGPLFLPDRSVVLLEQDGRISMGDHVHLRLPFRNNGTSTIHNGSLGVSGPQSGSDANVSVFDDTTWSETQQMIALTPSEINPGEIGWADFWIFVANVDPLERHSSQGQTWIRMESADQQWTIRLLLSPISFEIEGNEALKAGSCLHHPDNLEIWKYAQYAAAPKSPMMPPISSDEDPDTVIAAVRNLVGRVGDRTEFDYQDGLWGPRQTDVTLLANRHEFIGVCRDYADLTTGLLRSLGIPARYTDAWLVRWPRRDYSPIAGHAWVEAFVGADGWRQADSTWQTAFNEQVYEERGNKVYDVWADAFPLATAARGRLLQYRCVAQCYEDPVDCDTCFQESNMAHQSNMAHLEPTSDLSCVDDVTSEYHQNKEAPSSSIEEQLGLRIQGPIFITRTVPYEFQTVIVNSSTLPIVAITATIAISEYVDSRLPAFQVSPEDQTVSDVAPGEEITMTWTITPLMAGNGVTLRASAESGDLFAVGGHPLVVNEPGTAPDVILNGICGLSTTTPGQPITLTATLLDEHLEPITGTIPQITATIVSTPTQLFSTSVPLIWCEPCGSYQQVLDLPASAPIGNYEVTFHATHSGYEPDTARTFFVVAPVLSVILESDRTVADIFDSVTMTATVSDRGQFIALAGVWTEIHTPTGVVTIPLGIGMDQVYSASFTLADLAPNIGGSVEPGNWPIEATADYEGGVGTASTTICVVAGDVDGDGQVTVADIFAVADRWYQVAGIPYDRDGDEVVTVADIMIIAAHWGEGCP